MIRAARGKLEVPTWWLAALTVGAVTQAGCGSKAAVRIIQPGLPTPQDVVRLRSAWAYASDDEPGVERIVLMFPLPGARAGDRQFFVYLRVPGKRSKPIHIGEPLPGGGHVGGFLIQATGRLAGKALFAKGRIDLHGAAFDGGRRRRGKIALYCEDGSLLDGEFMAVVAPLEVSDFEEAKAGDVRALMGADRASEPGKAGPGPIGPGLGPTDAGDQP